MKPQCQREGRAESATVQSLALLGGGDLRFYGNFTKRWLAFKICASHANRSFGALGEPIAYSDVFLN